MAWEAAVTARWRTAAGWTRKWNETMAFDNARKQARRRHAATQRVTRGRTTTAAALMKTADSFIAIKHPRSPATPLDDMCVNRKCQTPEGLCGGWGWGGYPLVRWLTSRTYEQTTGWWQRPPTLPRRPQSVHMLRLHSHNLGPHSLWF